MSGRGCRGVCEWVCWYVVVKCGRGWGGRATLSALVVLNECSACGQCRGVCELVCCGRVGGVGATLSALVFWNESNVTCKWCAVSACSSPCTAPKKFLSHWDKNVLIRRFSKIEVFLGLSGAVRALANTQQTAMISSASTIGTTKLRNNGVEGRNFRNFGWCKAAPPPPRAPLMARGSFASPLRTSIPSCQRASIVQNEGRL